MSDSGREWPSEQPISREALMKTIENLTVSNQELLTENYNLRVDILNLRAALKELNELHESTH